jgi:predicted DNA-binding transcriptional regulator YafY
MSKTLPGGVVYLTYRNHRGEEGLRRIVPRSIEFTATEWHPEPQWVLHAFDLDRDAERTFALKDVLRWEARP